MEQNARSQMEITLDGGAVISAHFGGFTVKTDQPIPGGGSAPSPYSLFLASLGTCAGIYIKSFCDNRQISTEGIKIIQYYLANETTGLPDKIVMKIILPKSFPEKYKGSVIRSAEQCKVKKTITAQPDFLIETVTVE